MNNKSLLQKERNIQKYTLYYCTIDKSKYTLCLLSNDCFVQFKTMSNLFINGYNMLNIGGHRHFLNCSICSCILSFHFLSSLDA